MNWEGGHSEISKLELTLSNAQLKHKFHRGLPRPLGGRMFSVYTVVILVGFSKSKLSRYSQVIVLSEAIETI